MSILHCYSSWTTFDISNARNFGASQLVVAATTKVMQPPKTTDATVPISLAMTPDSNSPISLDDPTKIELTDATRPFMWSGVTIWNMVQRTKTLTASNPPLSISHKNDQ